ncbi:hypothetical protein niasHT_022759 [Heterodera trifolii]|uniref:Uncharacterized protein n=1 Tax=Heterodera trifolii TaxID=157864 RepID=A0ABD2K6P2_9BILA
MAGEKQEQQQKKQNELRKNMTMLDRAVVAVENARDEAAENDRQQVSPAFYNEFNGRFENSDDRRTQAWIRQLLFEVNETNETNRKEEDNKATTTDGTVIFLSICFGVSVGFIIGKMFNPERQGFVPGLNCPNQFIPVGPSCRASPLTHCVLTANIVPPPPMAWLHHTPLFRVPCRPSFIPHSFFHSSPHALQQRRDKAGDGASKCVSCPRGTKEWAGGGAGTGGRQGFSGGMAGGNLCKLFCAMSAVSRLQQPSNWHKSAGCTQM